VVDVPSLTPTSDSAADGAPGLFGVVVEQGAYGGPRTVWTVPSAAEARDKAVERVEDRASDWERRAIDEVLDNVMAEARQAGSTFSANTVRPRLPEGVHRPLIAARFLAAAKAGRIVRVGYIRSTDPRTRRSVVAVWRPAQ